MATYTDTLKRKRADSTLDCITVLTVADIATNPTIDDETDNERYGLPSNIEDDSDESDIEQPIDTPLTSSTLFWST